MTYVPGRKYAAVAADCLRGHPPPLGYILPVLTREGERRAVAIAPVPVDIRLPGPEARIGVLPFAPSDIVHRLQALTAQGHLRAEPAKIAVNLLSLIAVELMLGDREEFRPPDDRVVAIWAHLGDRPGRYTISGLSFPRADIAPAPGEAAGGGCVMVPSDTDTEN